MRRYDIPPRPAQRRKQIEEQPFSWQPFALLFGAILVSAAILTFQFTRR